MIASQDSTIGAYTIHLNMFALKDSREVNRFEENIYKKLPASPPKMMVLIGNPSFVLCDSPGTDIVHTDDTYHFYAIK